MLRGGSAVVRVFLCSLSLLGLLSEAARPCSLDIIKRVQTLRNNTSATMTLDCRLYTPTAQDYEQNCPSATLKCFAAEMKVLTQELEILGMGTRSKLNRELEKLARFTTKPESRCPDCELLEEKNVQMFLEDLLSILHMMNSLHCKASE